LWLVAERPTLWRRQTEDKRQPDPGQRRSATASRVLPMFPHRRLDLGRSVIKKTRASTAVSEAFAEAAERRKSWLYVSSRFRDC
jgi:hypothetical protein